MSYESPVNDYLFPPRAKPARKLKGKAMNYSTAIFLISEKVRAVAVVYEKINMDEDTTQMKYKAAYLTGGRLPKDAVVFKTMDPDMAVNDFAIIPTNTRQGMTVGKVVAVDVEIDFESDKEVHWVIGKVDTTEFEELRQKEEQSINAIKDSQVQKKRTEMRADFLATLGDKEIPLLDKPKDASE